MNCQDFYDLDNYSRGGYMDRNDYDEIYEDNEQNNDVNQIQQKQKATNQIKEQVKQQAKEQVKKEAVKQVKQKAATLLPKILPAIGSAISAIGWPVILGILAAILIIVILIVSFTYIYQGLSGRWDKITDLWGHLWTGTASKISDEDVSVLYYNLTNQGIDFEEIGAVGEHSFLGANQSFIDDPKLREEAERKIDQVRDKYAVQYYLDTITDSDLRAAKIYQYVDNETGEGQSLVIKDKMDKNGNIVMETKMEAAQRLLSQKLLAVRENNFIESGDYANYNMLNVDEGIGLYLKRYLLAEAETFTTRNEYTFAGEGYKGSIYIDGGQEEKSVSDQIVDNLKVASIFISPITAPVVMFSEFFNFVDGITMVEQENINGTSEMVVKFEKERKGIAAIALTTDTSVLTATGNDYGFEEIFAKQVEAIGQKGDVLIAISTSGNSKNIIVTIPKQG